MAGPPVEDFLAATGTPWDVKVVGSGTSKFPLIQTRAYNASIVLRQGWSWTNNSTVAKSYGQVSPAIVNLATVDVNTSMAIAQGAEWSFNTGNFGRVDGKGATITNGAFSGNLNWNWPGISCLDLTLAGNLTAGSIIYGMPQKGYVLDMILKQDATGTRTVTLGSSFVTGAGAAVSITGSAAAAVCIMKFVSDGVHLVLQGNQSPAFI
jgi:hypothetical protein